MPKGLLSKKQLWIISQHVLGAFLIVGTCLSLSYFLFFKTYTAATMRIDTKPYTITIHTSPTPTPVKIPTVVQETNHSTPQDNTQWGVATHIGGPLWQIKLGADARMGTPQEIFDALNHYRQVHGAGTLQWDQTLANYALQRAQTYTALGKLDNHAGFNDFVTNQDGFHKLGYQALGENGALLNEPLLGVHIIEWLFAGDPDHNANQLNPRWSNVGIGVDGFAVDVIFGGSRF